MGATTLTPFAAIAPDVLWQAGFSESTPPGGMPDVASPALQYAGRSEVSVPLILGANASRGFDLGNGHVLAAAAELGWAHEFQPQRSLATAFVAAPDVAFRVTGVSASRDAAQTGIATSLSLTQHVSVFGSFTGQFSGSETAFGGVAGLHVTW